MLVVYCYYHHHTQSHSLVSQSQTLLNPHCIVITKGSRGAGGAGAGKLWSLLSRTYAGVGLGGNIPSSDTQVGGCDLSFYAHPLVFSRRLLERSSWGSWPGSCPFPSPCPHLEESMGPSSPPPGECRPGPSWARGHSAVHIALCICGGLVSVSGVLYGHLGGGLAGGDCSHEGVCVCLCGHGGACAARVVTHDVCGFSCGGTKRHPTSCPEEQGAEESPGCVLGNRTMPCLQPQSPFPTRLEAGCAGWKGTPL